MSRRESISNRWTVGVYTFFEHTEYTDAGDVVTYSYSIGDGRPWERTATLDKALLAAVGERHTGQRGAGGTGVGTAADWFAAAIGLEPNQ